MAEALKDIELRSEEVQEILSKVPAWMVRWGSVLVFIMILLIIGIAWVVKYPDIIQSTALITTQNPPQKEFAKATGKLDSIYVHESQIVSDQQILAVIENAAITTDVLYLKSILDTLTFEGKHVVFPMDEIPILVLGDIETSFADFENSYTDYELNRTLKPFNNEAIANQSSLNELKIRLQNMRSQYDLNESGLQLKRNDLHRNRGLLDKGVVSQLDFEKKQLDVLNAEQALKDLNANISRTRQAISNATKDSQGTEIKRTREETRLLRRVMQSYNLLKKAIRDWENLYVLKSEMQGRVSMLHFWNSNQTVNTGDLVFTIVPMTNENYIAKVRARALNSGKIEVGQRANIMLENYPDTEFGILEGTVRSISLTPDSEGFYIIDVVLPDRLITSYNKEITFSQEMKGTAEIITEDLRLLERFLYPFRKILD